MTSLRRASILGLLAIAVTVCASGQTNPKNIDTAADPKGLDPTAGTQSPLYSGVGYGPAHPELYQLWKRLPGRYEKNEDGSRRIVTLKAISPYVLFVENRLLAGGQESVERGWLYLGDVSTSYNSPKMRFALSYRPDSLRGEYGCALYGYPSANGITFESEGSDCSFTLGRPVSKLRVDAAAGMISISDAKDAETTVLTRVSAH